MNNEKKQTAVEWLIVELNSELNYIPITQWDRIRDLIQRAKEMEKEQKNKMPIHIHEGISNTWVYIEDGVVHVKPNDKTYGGEK